MFMLSICFRRDMCPNGTVWMRKNHFVECPRSAQRPRPSGHWQRSCQQRQGFAQHISGYQLFRRAGRCFNRVSDCEGDNRLLSATVHQLKVSIKMNQYVPYSPVALITIPVHYHTKNGSFVSTRSSRPLAFGTKRIL